jgi:hypothetical protein
MAFSWNPFSRNRHQA